MRLGIVGYGQMGKLIHRIALSHGYEVPEIVDPGSSAAEVTARELTSISAALDVIIDFTHPEVVVSNIERCGELKIPAVIGTTGWYDQMERVAAIVEKTGIGLIWSGNFSLGVNLFFQMVENASLLMNRFSQYDAVIHEYHHRNKADSPSGTAQMLGDIMIRNMERKSKTVSDLPQGRIGDHELHLSSTRDGSIPGRHQVIFDSEDDTIVLEHSARNRKGFADGALVAARWICGRKGLFNIKDMMQSIAGGEKNR